MAHRSRVPKFGNWESDENVPYTVYFDKARQGRTGTKMINPNDPEENPDLLAESEGAPSQIPPPSPPRVRPETDELTGQGPIRSVHHEKKISIEEGERRPFSGSPARGDNFGTRPSNGSNHQQHGARGNPRGSAGSEYSIEKSPLHHQARASSEYSVDRSPIHHQARALGRGSGSPSSENVKNSRDSSHGTPGRSRLGGAPRGDDLDKGSTLPKFGDWDENDPASGDGYTHIFNKVREEKHGGQPNGAGVPGGSPYRANVGKRTHSNDSKSFCCFPWSRK